MTAKGLERKGNAKSGVCPVRIPTVTSHAPYLEGGVLLHVPQQMWLLGCRVVTHSALELLPWKEAEDKVSNARLAVWACKRALPGGRADSQRGSGRQRDQLSGSSSGKEITTEGRDWSASPRAALSSNTEAHFYRKRYAQPPREKGTERKRGV